MLRIGIRIIIGFELVFLTACSSLEKKETTQPAETYSRPKDLENFEIRLEVERHELPNGLRLIFIEDHTIPLVSFQTWYRVGTVDESWGQSGLAHLFEHMMFKGTQTRDSSQFIDQLEADGVALGAFAARDYTVFHSNFTPNHLKRIIELESDRMVNLKIDQKTLIREIQISFEERRLQVEDNVSGKVQEELWQMAYRFHPYQRPILGTPRDMASLQVGAVKKFYESYYHPSNATIVVVGDFNSDQAMEWIKENYGPLPEREVPPRQVIEEPQQNSERRLRMVSTVASPRLAQAYHVTRAENLESYALDVLSNILFKGPHSRAYQKLVREKNYFVGLTGSAYTPTYPGLLVINGTLNPKADPQVAEESLDDVIQSLVENGVTQKEVDRAVRQLILQIVDSVVEPSGLAQLVGTVQVILGDSADFREDVDKYLRVEPQEVQKVARKYLDPNNRNTIWVFPQEKE